MGIHRHMVRVIALLAVTGVTYISLAERIPLRSGRTLNREIVGYTPKGIRIKEKYGEMVLPWAQVSAKHPRHPLHEQYEKKKAERAERRAEREQGGQGKQEGKKEQEGQEERPDDSPRRAERSEEPELDGNALGLISSSRDLFLLAMLAAFAVFWLNILSVWLVSYEDLVGGSRLQNWNLAALVFGPPVALLFLLRHKGLRGMFKFASNATRVAVSKKGADAECRLFSWDGEPVKPTRGRGRSTGLVSAQALLGRAGMINASDIHFDTTNYGVEVKYRVDGVLREPETLTEDIGKKTTAAIKNAAAIDMGRIHEAQDGACHMAVNGVWYDLRVARAWAVNGETLVVRLLKTTGMGTELTDLGMTSRMADEIQRGIQETAGIIILAGPTGSGKTSTIYALIRRIVGTGRNILTIEDPVEYRMENVTQISLNPRVGSTFATALKASMRHDPDVIFVGEIRDKEAMDVAFQAGLTGHLVFTTIHASSVLATFGRLHEMGLSAYMINTGLKVIVCQRLIRILCPTCREPYFPDERELQLWDISPDEGAGHCFFKPVGCRLCEETGYHGRTGVYRMLFMNNELRNLVRPDMQTGELQRLVDRHAFGNPKQAARDLLWEGVTAPGELQRTLDMFDFGKHLAHTPTAPPQSAAPQQASTLPAGVRPLGPPVPAPQQFAVPSPEPQPLEPAHPGLQPLGTAPPGLQPLEPTPSGLQPLDSAPPGLQPLESTPTGLEPLGPAPPGLQPLDTTPAGLQPLDPAPPGLEPLEPVPPGFEPLDPPPAGPLPGRPQVRDPDRRPGPPPARDPGGQTPSGNGP